MREECLNAEIFCAPRRVFRFVLAAVLRAAVSWPVAARLPMKSRASLLLLLLLTAAAVPVRAAGAAPLNVLFIAVDDLRPDIRAYGHRLARTPHLDRLAARGVIFERAYCQFALCNPSRASLLSGRRPETLRVFTLANFVRDRNPDVVTLPELFRRSGYETRSYGKIFHAGNGNHDDPLSWSIPPWHNASSDPGAPPKKKRPAADQDPDSVDHANDLPAEAPDVADEALIDGQIATRAVRALGELKGRPFFLAVGFHRPHLPFVAPKRYWDLYDAAQVPLAPNPRPPEGAPDFATNDASELRRYQGIPKQGPPVDDARARELIHGYLACVSYVDAQIGRVLAELERLGLQERTIVMLWGDHGYQLGEHGTWNKRTNWEIATRVPLMVAAPGAKARGAKSRALVELVDLYPTLAGLCGLPLPEKLEGTSFAPLLDDPLLPWKRAAFSFYTKKVPGLGDTAVHGRAMRTDTHRLVEWTGARLAAPVYELYDHRSDPQENVNLAARPESRELLERLKAQLAAGWAAARP